MKKYKKIKSNKSNKETKNFQKSFLYKDVNILTNGL